MSSSGSARPSPTATGRRSAACGWRPTPKCPAARRWCGSSSTGGASSATNSAWTSDGVWLPDAAGASAAFPQLAALSGARWFLGRRPDAGTAVPPHHTFRWEGIDGTRLFTHLAPGGPEGSTLTGGEVTDAVADFAEKGAATRSLLPFGRSDGGPDRDMLERARRLADLEGAPRVALRSPAHFFRDAEAGIRCRPGVARRDRPGTAPRLLHQPGPHQARQPAQRGAAARGRAVVGDGRRTARDPVSLRGVGAAVEAGAAPAVPRHPARRLDRLGARGGRADPPRRAAPAGAADPAGGRRPGRRPAYSTPRRTTAARWSCSARRPARTMSADWPGPVRRADRRAGAGARARRGPGGLPLGDTAPVTVAPADDGGHVLDNGLLRVTSTRTAWYAPPSTSPPGARRWRRARRATCCNSTATSPRRGAPCTSTRAPGATSTPPSRSKSATAGRCWPRPGHPRHRPLHRRPGPHARRRQPRARRRHRGRLARAGHRAQGGLAARRARREHPRRDPVRARHPPHPREHRRRRRPPGGRRAPLDPRRRARLGRRAGLRRATATTSPGTPARRRHHHRRPQHPAARPAQPRPARRPRCPALPAHPAAGRRGRRGHRRGVRARPPAASGTRATRRRPRWSPSTTPTSWSRPSSSPTTAAATSSSGCTSPAGAGPATTLGAGFPVAAVQETDLLESPRRPPVRTRRTAPAGPAPLPDPHPAPHPQGSAP